LYASRDKNGENLTYLHEEKKAEIDIGDEEA